MRLATASLGSNDLDLPFVLAYRVDSDGRHAHLVATSGVVAGSPASPSCIDLQTNDDLWAIGAARTSARRHELHDIADRFDGTPCGPYRAPPSAAVVCPVAIGTGELPSIFIVAGASACRAIDVAYREFFAMVNDGVATAVSKAHAYAQTTRRAEALVELDRAKTDFFANVSHEFRTPLTLMLGPLDRVLHDEGAALSPSVREQLDIARRNGERMEKLVNTLLDLSRVEAGRSEASFQPLDLTAFTRHLCGMFSSTIERGGLGFEVVCEPLDELPFVDRDMWETILLNLLSNAFKFTLHGRIDVHLRRENQTVRLDVGDTGIGIGMSAVRDAVHQRGGRARHA